MKQFLKSYNIFTVVFAVFVVLVIHLTPIFGVGDLAEYTSTFESVGLYNATSDTYAITQNYGITSPAAQPKSFFEMFLLGVIGINKLIFSKTVFNIHFLSGVYSIIFLIGIYFLQKNMKFKTDYVNYVFSALLAIVFLDMGYIAYLNSFYTDALILVLALSIFANVLAISEKITVPKLLLFVILSTCFALIKFSCAVVGVLLAVVLFAVGFKVKGKRIACVVASLIVAVVSVFSMFNAYVPAREVKLYNLIYNDLAVSDTEALNHFNLEGRDFIENPTIEDMEKSVSGVNYVDVVNYYTSKPSVFYENVKSAVNNSYFLVHNASYLEAGANYGFRAMLPLKIWNKLKKTILPQGVWVVLGLILIYMAVAVFEYIKNRKNGNKKGSIIALFALALPVGALSELVATVITTGKILVSKNMISFGIYFDLMLITAVVWGLSTLVTRNSDIKNKYGVNQ